MTEKYINVSDVEDDETLLYDKEINCPCCKSKFTYKKIKFSRLRLITRDDLLVNHYKNIVPIRYGIIVCPTCGYSAPENKFQKLSPIQIKIIQDGISINWKPRDFTGLRNDNQAIKAYKLALYQGLLLNYNNFEMGRLSFNLGWLAEDYKERIRFLRLARDKFIIAYTDEDVSSVNQNELTYRIAELSRLINDLNTSSKWFAICVQSPGIRANYMLSDLAKEKWMEVKAELTMEAPLLAVN